ncbi:MAG: arylsulfatase [Cytophagales bacterium]|nr:arylsulfatase [Cytophagales bacterium]
MKMKNLSLIKLVICAISSVIFSCENDSKNLMESKKPNILLVVADDLGWTDLGCYGSEIRTPNIDELANNSVLFTDFHVSQSCSPTRSMLLTGNDNHIAGMGNMAELLTPEQKGKPGYEGYLNDRVITLAEVLHNNGYHTYMGGKWHLGHDKGQLPFDRGFENSYSLLYGGASFWSDMSGALAFQPVAKYVHNDEFLNELPKDFYATRSYTDYLIESIRKNKDDGRPFFAYLAFTAPHDPLHVPEPWKSMYRGTYNDGYESLKIKRAKAAKHLGLFPEEASVSKMFADTEVWESLNTERKKKETKAMEVYAGMISNMDYHYGRIESFLKDIGEYENTIIVFMSDNGPNPWFSEDYPGNEGSEWFSQFDNSIDNIGDPMSHYAYGIGWAGACSGPLNLFKMSMAEGGIRSPLLIKAPGIEQSKQLDCFTYVWDIMPTILDMTDVSYPDMYMQREIEPMRGKSLLQVLTGKETLVYKEDELVCGDLGGNGLWVRQGGFKAMMNTPPYGDGKWQLYNLHNDPGETNDLSDEMPEKLKKLQNAWDNYAKDVGVVMSDK